MSRVLRVLLASGVAFVQAGSGKVVYRPRGIGPAVKAAISDPQAVAIDSAGTLYIAENKNVIRRVDLGSGIITPLQSNRDREAIGSHP